MNSTLGAQCPISLLHRDLASLATASRTSPASLDSTTDTSDLAKQLESSLESLRAATRAPRPSPSVSSVQQFWTAFSRSASSPRRRKALVRSGGKQRGAAASSTVAALPIHGVRHKVWCELLGAARGEAPLLHYQQLILQIFDGVGPDEVDHAATVALLPWYDASGVAVDAIAAPTAYPAWADEATLASAKRCVFFFSPLHRMTEYFTQK